MAEEETVYTEKQFMMHLICPSAGKDLPSVLCLLVPVIRNKSFVFAFDAFFLDLAAHCKH